MVDNAGLPRRGEGANRVDSLAATPGHRRVLAATEIAELAEIFQGYTEISVSAVLFAACVSPTARHRHTALAALWVASLRHPPAGGTSADADVISVWLEDAQCRLPILRDCDDYVGLDPRFAVAAYPLLGQRIQVHPGALEDPLRAVDDIVDFALTIDDSARATLGFGCNDVLQLARVLLDDQMPRFRATWPPLPVVDISGQDLPRLTGEEVEAADRYLENFEVDRLELTATMSAALAALTADAHDLEIEVGLDASIFGPVLAVATGTGIVPFPAAYLLEGAAAFADTLVHHSGRLASRGELADQESVTAVVRQGWRRIGLYRLEEALAASDSHVLFPVELPDIDVAGEVVLIATGHRHAIVLTVLAELDSAALAQQVDQSRAALGTRLGAGTSLRLPPGSFDFEESPSLGSSYAAPSGYASAMPFCKPDAAGRTTFGPDVVVQSIIVVHGPWEPSGPPSTEDGQAACLVVTLNELREMLADSRSGELWPFLDEVVSLLSPGGDEPQDLALQAFALTDAWQLWRRDGYLYPAWTPDHALIDCPPTSRVESWERQARRQPLDELLYEAGMPTTRYWHDIGEGNEHDGVITDQLDLSGFTSGWSDARREAVSLSTYRPRRIAFASVTDRLIVSTELDAPWLGETRGLAARLADALHSQLQKIATSCPEARTLWSDVFRADFLHVELAYRQAAEGVEDRNDAPLIWPAGSGRGFLQLIVEQEALTLGDETRLHEELGMAMTYGLIYTMDSTADIRPGADDAFTGPSAETIQSASLFANAWLAHEPALTMSSYSKAFAKTALALPSTITPGARRRAERATLRRLRIDLPPGVIPGRAVREQVYATAIGVLVESCAPFSASELLAAAAGEIERAYNERWLDRMHRSLALQDRWALDHYQQMRATPPDDSGVMATRSAELLIETVLKHRPTGTAIPDRRDLEDLLARTAWPLDLALRAAYSGSGLQPLAFGVDAVGRFLIAAAGKPAAAVDQWRHASYEYSLRSAVDFPDDLKPGDAAGPDAPAAEDRPFSSVVEALRAASSGPGPEADLNQELLAVNEAIEASWKFDLDGLFATLDTLIAWTTNDEPLPPLGVATRGELIEDIVRWTDLPRNNVAAAVDRLTISSNQMVGVDLAYWLLEQRANRLTLRPIIRANDGTDDDPILWILPRLAHHTKDVMLRYLSDGRLPWPHRSQSTGMRAALARWRRLSENQLERAAQIAVKSAQCVAIRNLTPNKARAQQIEIPGEIDLLAFDVERRRIWVMECKHLHEPFSPPEMTRHLLDFHGRTALPEVDQAFLPKQAQTTKKSYVDKLLAKAHAVRAHQRGVLRLAGLAPQHGGDDPWIVIPLFVTEHVEFAAFAAEPRVAFAPVSYLAEMLAGAGLPSSGWWSPTFREP